MKQFFCCLLAACICIFTASVCPAQLTRFVFSQPKMGSPFTIIFYADDSTKAASLARQCFRLTDDYVSIFSDYIDSSELNRLCATAGKTGRPFIASPALFDILVLSKVAFEKSGGTFDITLGPVTRLWRKARKENTFPTYEAVKNKLALTGFRKIKIDTITHEVKLMEEGMQLDLGGIAQGYIGQKVANFLRENLIENALIDVSGDIVAIGTPPGTNGWTIGVNMPESADDVMKQPLLITNKAVTTSGDVYQFIEHDGKRYSHIVHPKTGYGITTRRNVTVIANDGTVADWLTKACSLLPIGKAKKLVAQMNAEFLIAEMKDEKLLIHATKGFTRYWKTQENNTWVERK